MDGGRVRVEFGRGDLFPGVTCRTGRTLLLRAAFGGAEFGESDLAVRTASALSLVGTASGPGRLPRFTTETSLIGASVVGRLPDRLLDSDACGAEQRAQLTDEILPFADAHEIEELFLAPPTEFRGSHVGLQALQVVPQVEVGQEVTAPVSEPGMFRIGGGSDLGRPFPGILDRQCGDDDGDLSPAAGLRSGDDHSGQARIDRQHGEFPTGLSDVDLPGRIAGQRPKLGEHRASVTDGSGLRRGEEREVEDLLVARRESQ